MNFIWEIIKLIIELLIIIFVSKNLLVPVLRKVGELLELKPQIIGNISGIATSIPEFLTVTFSSISGMADAGIFNILSSNIINCIQYILAMAINKNLKVLKNKALKINLVLVLITIIIPIIIWKIDIGDSVAIAVIYIILFYVFNKINKHYNGKLNIETKETISHVKTNKKKITIYFVYILLIGIILYLVGNLLSDTLENLRYIFDVSEIIIGIVLGIATSIPEFVTFIESQKFHKNSNEELGVIEASNNLLVSNTLNLFIIQSISIIIINFLE